MKALILCFSLFCSCTAAGQQLAPVQQRLAGWAAAWRQAGYLPGWVDINDPAGIAFDGTKLQAAVCIVDGQTRLRWVIGGTTAAAYRLMASQLEDWLALTQRMRFANDEELLLCQRFFSGYAPPVLRPIGEPRYRALVRTSTDPFAPIDWAVMNGQFVLGPTSPADRCASPLPQRAIDHSDPRVGWYTHPAGGITRCRPD